MTTWSDLPDLLSWVPGADWTALTEVRRRAAERDVGAALERLAGRDADGARELRAALAALDETSRRRVQLAPRTQACLTLCPPSHHAPYLAAAISAEHARRGRQWDPLARGSTCEACRLVAGGWRWTSLADVAVPLEEGVGLRQPEVLPGVTPGEVPGVVLDLRGPAVTGTMPDIPGTGEALGGLDAERLHAKLLGASSWLQDSVPSAAKLVGAVTRTVVCRRDPSGPGACGASSSMAIGQTVLSNPQVEGVDETWLIETLVHEAVHATIDILQPAHPMLEDPRTALRERVDSPWSGRSLDLDTYLQACWVWYAIAWVWAEVALRGGAARSAAVHARGARALRGFTLGDVVDRLGDRRQLVDFVVVEALGDAQARLRALR